MNLAILAVAAIALSAPLSAADELYHEAFRPQVHFTARQWTYQKPDPVRREEGWQNDINGLVYVAGEYHYFAQRWAQAWIHAVSKDLIHWEELKPAFWVDHPVDDGWVQSGSAVIDSLNVTGLKSGSNPLMVAFYSSGDNKNQNLAYSNDLGRTWTKYAANPVLAHAERDPKVFRHAASKKWVMVLYQGPGYHFFTSDNLIDWQKQSSVDGFYECPDMFELAVDGNPADSRWVLMNGDGSYQIGRFDGKAFSAETQKRRLEWGPHFYATQSWNNIPASDGRRIQLAWMRSDNEKFFPGMPFNQQTSFPVVLTLRDYADSLRIFRNPVRELEKLHEAPKVQKGKSLGAGASLALDQNSELYRIQAAFTLGDDTEGEFNIHGIPVKFSNGSISVNGSVGPFARKLGKLSLELLIDRTSIEAFGNGGEVSITRNILAKNRDMGLRCNRGSLTVDSITQYPLKSIWPAAVKQAFNTNIEGIWTAVAGTWKDTATGKVGVGNGDIFLLSPKSGSDFTYEGELSFRSSASSALAFRMDDGAAKGYVVCVDKGKYIKLWAPGRGELQVFHTPTQPYQPYHVKVVAKGANIKVYYNYRAKPIIDFNDANPVLSGRFGLNAYSGEAHFQDILVDAPIATALEREQAWRARSAGWSATHGKAFTALGRMAPARAAKGARFAR